MKETHRLVQRLWEWSKLFHTIYPLSYHHSSPFFVVLMNDESKVYHYCFDDSKAEKNLERIRRRRSEKDVRRRGRAELEYYRKKISWWVQLPPQISQTMQRAVYFSPWSYENHICSEGLRVEWSMEEEKQLV